LTKACGKNPSTDFSDIIAINATENGILTDDPAMVNCDLLKRIKMLSSSKG
jgi:hypothetical protein